MTSKDYNDQIKNCLVSLSRNSRSLETINRLAYLYFKEGDRSGALNMYRCSLKVDTNQPDIHSNVCVLLRRKGNFQEAIYHGDMAVSQNPTNARAYNNLGLAQDESGQLDKAEACYLKALALDPQDHDAIANLGSLYTKLGRSDEAIDILQTALKSGTKRASCFRNLGIALFHAGRLDEADNALTKATELDPANCKDWSNLGKVKKELGLYQEAEVCYRRALKLVPSEANANWNYAILKLLMGDYLTGFKHYEYGWAAGQRKPLRSFTKPIWLGKQPISGKRVLVTVEQGFGDNMLCVRFADALKKMGATVILEATQPLQRLFKFLKGGYEVIAAGQEPQDYDYFCPIMSLPLAIGLELDRMESLDRYFFAAENDCEKFNCLMPSDKLRVGIVWSGRESPPGRSIDLSQFSQIFSADASFVVLQKDIGSEESELLARFSNVYEFSSKIVDFYDTACLIENLDLVVSIDTSVAHLSGGLGKPTMLLLKHIPDWRWLTSGDESPWFKSLKLLRQCKRDDWSPILEKIRVDVDQMAREKGTKA